MTGPPEDSPPSAPSSTEALTSGGGGVPQLAGVALPGLKGGFSFLFFFFLHPAFDLLECSGRDGGMAGRRKGSREGRKKWQGGMEVPRD